MNIINDNKPRLPGSGIAELEDKIGKKLPVEYVNFLERYNGGQPLENKFHIPDCDSDSLIDHFLGMGRPSEDIMDWIDELDDLAGRFIPIGFDPGGNALILDYLDGTIYYWDSARHFECSTDEENTYWIANSFGELMGSLSSAEK